MGPLDPRTDHPDQGAAEHHRAKEIRRHRRRLRCWSGSRGQSLNAVDENWCCRSIKPMRANEMGNKPLRLSTRFRQIA